LLFEILRVIQTVSAILLLGGLWVLVFGLLLDRKNERLYYSGFGAIIALLSTFLFIPLRFTAGLVIVAIVVLAIISAVSRPSVGHSPPAHPTPHEVR
jgi:predicted MFS family arabinose efflux permease